MAWLIKKAQPDGPYSFAGHSFGGRVIFEMARKLQSKNDEVRLLAMLDAPAPVDSTDHSHLPRTEAEWAVRQLKDFEGFFGIDLTAEKAEIAGLPTRDIHGHLQTSLAGRLGMDLPPARLRGMMDVYKMQTRMRYCPPLKSYAGTIVVFSAEGENRNGAGMLGGAPRTPTLGWEQFTTADVVVVPTPGEHLTMITDPLSVNLPRR